MRERCVGLSCIFMDTPFYSKNHISNIMKSITNIHNYRHLRNSFNRIYLQLPSMHFRANRTGNTTRN